MGVSVLPSPPPKKNSKLHGTSWGDTRGMVPGFLAHHDTTLLTEGGFKWSLHTVGRFFLQEGPLLAINGVYRPFNGLINVVAGVILSL